MAEQTNVRDRKGVLVGRVAVVTGASRGIGAAIARTLADIWAVVAVNHRRGQADAHTAEEFHQRGGSLYVIPE